MNLEHHHRLALLAALGLSGVALFDATTQGLTGNASVFADESDAPVLQAVGAVLHGLAYLAALHVLHTERRALRVNRAATASWWLLVAALLPLALGFLLLAPVQAFGLGDAAYALLTPVVAGGFALHFLAALGLGLSLLRRPEADVGARVLASIPLWIGLTVLLGFLAGGWAHPAYVETATIVGIALLGATARRPHRVLVASHPT